MIAYLANSPSLAIAVPLAVTVLALLAGGRLGRHTAWLALPGPLAAFAVGAAYLAAGESPVEASVPWLDAGEQVLHVGWRLDGLGAVMLVVVGVVAAMVMVFSVGYMADEKGLGRYFGVLALFTASMCGVVIARDLLTLFIAWELVGVCSYLLIGFWYDRPSAADAARKAFLVTRVGDAGLLLAMGVLWSAGALDTPMAELGAAGLPAAVAAVAALFVFVGAAGKSAQFPLHVWLPDAMEGPTPVSALIHAATMVAAGVFLVARTWPLFEAAPAVRAAVLVIGTVTALGAAGAALAQRDIKKVLAYSTISQLGFMFAALGAGAWGAAMFHLVTHAAFKALLFLGAGSVIHGSGTQDLREMGGLARTMKATAFTWIVGVGALAGVPPLAGFFSKDEVVAAVLRDAPWAGVALLLAAALTGAYTARTTRLAFFGEPRGAHEGHESPMVMLVPLAILALGAAVLGFAGHSVAVAIGAEAEALNWTTAAFSIVAALAGIVFGWYVLGRDPASDESLTGAPGAAWRALGGAYGFDGFVSRFVVAPVAASSDVVYRWVDRIVVDGAVEGAGRVAAWVGEAFADLQSGEPQWYGALTAAGALLLLALTLAMGR